MGVCHSKKQKTLIKREVVEKENKYREKSPLARVKGNSCEKENSSFHSSFFDNADFTYSTVQI